jgi:hypothetical protein
LASNSLLESAYVRKSTLTLQNRRNHVQENCPTLITLATQTGDEKNPPFSTTQALEPSASFNDNEALRLRVLPPAPPSTAIWEPTSADARTPARKPAFSLGTIRGRFLQPDCARFLTENNCRGANERRTRRVVTYRIPEGERDPGSLGIFKASKPRRVRCIVRRWGAAQSGVEIAHFDYFLKYRLLPEVTQQTRHSSTCLRRIARGVKRGSATSFLHISGKTSYEHFLENREAPRAFLRSVQVEHVWLPELSAMRCDCLCLKVI